MALFDRPRVGGELRAKSWGHRAQIGEASRRLQQVLAGGQPVALALETDLFERNPALRQLSRFSSTVGTLEEKTASLQRFVDELEQAHGPLTELTANDVQPFELFRAKKALALVEHGRTPSQVVDEKLTVPGTSRSVLLQRWKPTGKPTREVVVLFPGYQQGIDHFQDRAARLSAQGADVILSNMPWVGEQSTHPGRVNGALEMAHDVATVLRHAGTLGGDRILPVAVSMSSSALWAASTLAENGLLSEELSIPRGLDCTYVDPYFAAAPNPLNWALMGLGKIPVLGDAPVPATGIPLLARRPDLQAEQAAASVLDDVRVRLNAFAAPEADLHELLARIRAGELRPPSGRMFGVIHAGDTVASSAEAKAYFGLQPPGRAQLEVLPGKDHLVPLEWVDRGLTWQRAQAAAEEE